MFAACGVSMLGAAGAALADTAETAKPRAPIKARAAMRIVSTSCATSRPNNDGRERQFRFSAVASPKGQDTPPFIYPPVLPPVLAESWWQAGAPNIRDHLLQVVQIKSRNVVCAKG